MIMAFFISSRDFLTLIKVRITGLVTLTAAAGYGLAPHPRWDLAFVSVVVGVFLITAGASTVNMYLERRTDALMNRTRLRPLPVNALRPSSALVMGLVISLAGLIVLLFIGMLPAGIAALSWVLYILVYTPLKAKTSLNTVVGAIPGALPPLIGWTATGAPLSMAAFIPFLLMVAWQVPHFLALAWMYREDYARGGLQMLTVLDQEGGMVGRQAVLYAICLVPITAAPLLGQDASLLGAFLGIGLSLVFVGFAARFALHRNRNTAASLFGVSLLYLPCAFGLMFL
ncbi:MAG: protoheme IX farnesyltransferase [Vicinamibacteria bacterium]|nr:protoheme IX farnesyltransferase [Vicinamibacteria bacterium]